MSENNISLKLSDLLNDIGVSESLVLAARKAALLRESMDNITLRLTDTNITTYYLGSQSEGTTTVGLQSDTDKVVCLQDINIIQDWTEWEQGKLNFFMIQDENTSPGYCFLQLLRSDEPLPETICPDDSFCTDRIGRILFKNNIEKLSMQEQMEQHGPSLCQNLEGFCDFDFVQALPCKSWPQSASVWLEKQETGKWPTEEMRRYASSTECFVVAVGSKVAVYPEVEWRISTSLAERCLMFNLNITQIRCYVLMKIIVKSFLNPQGKIHISSFMCKTVLLHSIENTEPSIWKENNLTVCLTYCLLELNTCIQNVQCRHFIISENNLMAGKFTSEAKRDLSVKLKNFIESGIRGLFQIKMDDLGQRLQDKLYRIPQRNSCLQKRFAICYSFIVTAHFVSRSYKVILKKVQNYDIDTMERIVFKLIHYIIRGNRLEYASCKMFAPFFCTSIGSVLASASIALNISLSPKGMFWLSIGENSDVSSGRLKLASVFYCMGKMEKTELILRHVEKQCHSHPVLPICKCWNKPEPTKPEGFYNRSISKPHENCLKYETAFCVRFLQKEMNCVPNEVQYEMFRSTHTQMIHRRNEIDYWMDLAVVDSLPFLYFLQYKTYYHLGKFQEKQQALDNLCRSIETDKNSIGHRESALNLLGQCNEQEGRPSQALECYISSLQVRQHNNAASVHICRLLSSLIDKCIV